MCRSKHYYIEHEAAYRRIEGEHKANWDALHEGSNPTVTATATRTGSTTTLVTPAADTDALVHAVTELVCAATGITACTSLRAGARVQFGVPQSAPYFSWVDGSAIVLNDVFRYARVDAVAAEVVGS